MNFIHFFSKNDKNLEQADKTVKIFLKIFKTKKTRFQCNTSVICGGARLVRIDDLQFGRWQFETKSVDSGHESWNIE